MGPQLVPPAQRWLLSCQQQCRLGLSDVASVGIRGQCSWGLASPEPPALAWELSLRGQPIEAGSASLTVPCSCCQGSWPGPALRRLSTDVLAFAAGRVRGGQEVKQ